MEQLLKKKAFLVCSSMICFLLLFLLWLNIGQTQSLGVTEHILIHSLVEIVSIFLCLGIFLYGSLIWNYTRSRIILFVSIGFFMIALLDLMHLLTFSDMQLLIVQTNHQTSIWFTMMGRVMEIVIMLLIAIVYITSRFKSKDRERLVLFGTAIVITALVISFLLILSPHLPPLMIEGVGTTQLNDRFEYTFVLFYLGGIISLLTKYRHLTKQIRTSLIISFSMLAFSNISLTLYESMYDFTIVIGHSLKIIGYIFILKLFYYYYIKKELEEKQTAKIAFYEVKQQLQSLFKYTPDAILLFRINDRIILSGNPAFTKMFGFKMIEGNSLDVIVPPEVFQDYLDVFTKLKQGIEIVDFKTKRYRSDGTLLNVSITYSPLQNDKGENALYFSIIRDITEQQNVERKIQTARQELIDLLQQYPGIIGKIRKVDGQFQHTFIDGNLLKTFNLEPALIIGHPIDSYVPQDHLDFFVSHYEQAWHGEEVVKEFAVNGMVILNSAIPVIKDGHVVELIISMVDVTMLKQTEELLRKTEKLSVVGELAAGFAHEIRNPLTTIKGFLQFIRSDIDAPNENYITLMLSEIDRLEMITNEFMVVAKPQATHYQLENLVDILQGVINFLTPQSLLKDIQIFATYQSTNPLVYCDKNQLKQVLINILKNATESMEHGGSITIQLIEKDPEIVISVTDQGCGIPDELIPRLGEPFYTLKEKGTGLGLMVSHKIIEAHNGTLEIKSKLQEGTTVIITIPKHHKQANQQLPSL